jgi:glycosyltransferase involved in cell wall biosynthesis
MSNNPEKLSIIIPSYNEEKTIGLILNKIISVDLYHNISKEIIVIDDGSTDNSEVIVSRFISAHLDIEINYIKQSKNGGKGSAIRTGIQNITGDYVIIQDADLEYDPQDYNKLLPILQVEGQDVVYGSRFLNKRNAHSYQTFYWGGRLVSWVTNLLYKQNLTDEPTCYKMFRSSLLKSIKLNCTGFEFCPEVTAKIAKLGYKIKEIPINYYPRSIKEGKKIKWTDGLEAIWILIKYRF